MGTTDAAVKPAHERLFPETDPEVDQELMELAYSVEGEYAIVVITINFPSGVSIMGLGHDETALYSVVTLNGVRRVLGTRIRRGNQDGDVDAAIKVAQNQFKLFMGREMPVYFFKRELEVEAGWIPEGPG